MIWYAAIGFVVVLGAGVFGAGGLVALSVWLSHTLFALVAGALVVVLPLSLIG